MPFGLVFLGDEGEVWTVDVSASQPGHTRRFMLFSHPTFLNASEKREFDGVPACWPDCSSNQLRGFLEAAHGATS